jgi:hypothetical protein
MNHFMINEELEAKNKILINELAKYVVENNIDINSAISNWIEYEEFNEGVLGSIGQGIGRMAGNVWNNLKQGWNQSGQGQEQPNEQQPQGSGPQPQQQVSKIQGYQNLLNYALRSIRAVMEKLDPNNKNIVINKLTKYLKSQEKVGNQPQNPAAVNPAAVDPAAVNPAAVNPAAVNPAAVDPKKDWHLDNKRQAGVDPNWHQNNQDQAMGIKNGTFKSHTELQGSSLMEHCLRIAGIKK